MSKSNPLLDEIEVLSNEIHSLLKQGVKELSKKRIEQRQRKIELLFIHPKRITDEDKKRLLAILSADDIAKKQLEEEQHAYHSRNRKRSKLKLYKQNT